MPTVWIATHDASGVDRRVGRERKKEAFKPDDLDERGQWLSVKRSTS